MTVFDSLYASAYDLLYADKDYAAEAAFLDRLVRRFRPGSKSLLDLGSGTGRHAVELTKLGYRVTGVERSEGMLQRAIEGVASSLPTGSKPAFVQGDLRDTRLEQKYDIVTTLFHVMSYQTTNEDLKAALKTAAVHTKEGGLFIFDYWYGPCVLAQQPSVRVKRLASKDLEIVRTAEPTLQNELNRVDVDYQIFVRSNGLEHFRSFTEHHEMRYLFLPEIRLLTNTGEWEYLHSGEWLTDANPSTESWGVFTILKRL